jgi:S-disulfanyl-L-cysteine oxidoreductase SoxD
MWPVALQQKRCLFGPPVRRQAIVRPFNGFLQEVSVELRKPADRKNMTRMIGLRRAGAGDDCSKRPECRAAGLPRLLAGACCILLFAGLACVVGPSWAGEDGIYSNPQAERGEALFQQHCAVCHGARLEGNPAVALTGPGYRARWEDGSHTLDDLFYIIRTLMPNTAPGSLSKPEYADIVAYILKVNAYPAGDAELVPKAATMKAVVLQPH